MVSTEEFSFPRITNPLPHFAISPSLWRVSSLVYPDYRYEDDERELPFFKQSFSFTTCQELKIESIEEKMDRLWEKFNEEELQRASSDSLGGKKGSYSVDSLDSEYCARGESRHLCRVKKELKISKSDRNIMISASTQSKRQQIVMVFKVLKKIFLHPISSKGLKEKKLIDALLLNFSSYLDKEQRGLRFLYLQPFFSKL